MDSMTIAEPENMVAGGHEFNFIAGTSANYDSVLAPRREITVVETGAVEAWRDLACGGVWHAAARGADAIEFEAYPVMASDLAWGSEASPQLGGWWCAAAVFDTTEERDDALADAGDIVDALVPEVPRALVQRIERDSILTQMCDVPLEYGEDPGFERLLRNWCEDAGLAFEPSLMLELARQASDEHWSIEGIDKAIDDSIEMLSEGMFSDACEASETARSALAPCAGPNVRER